LLILALAYGGMHAVQGKYGLAAYQQLKVQEAALAEEARRLAVERARLEAELRLMQPEALDRDWLDEAARERLGLAHPGDVIVLTPPEPNP